jgi:hypothetical protein
MQDSKKNIVKILCTNPNTTGQINIDKNIYDLFSDAIIHTLKKTDLLTYTEMVRGVKKYLSATRHSFKGSVGWYAVVIKNDLHFKGIIEVISDKGKKLHRLVKVAN